ncbi:MAG: 4'-phosphopantetheinyl transferase family protein [Pelagimonas sp.]|uniref:4'-phosphopantetheinyl transferase family protein n=1 Tax=Pelagimonas sp. TaxID=2073170 RepID=UPI003D6BFAD8
MTDLSDFLAPPVIRRIETGIMVTSTYTAAAFSTEMFEQFGIERPDRLCRAVDKRLAEFLAGRLVAQIAQKALGREPQEIGIAQSRAPVWPSGLAGSISHARSFCACYVVPKSAGHPGIDIEAIASGNALKSIQQMVLGAADHTQLEKSDLFPDIAGTLGFSAKETLFKALFPTVQHHFGFACAELREPPKNGVIRLYLTQDLHRDLPAGAGFDIHYEIGPKAVLTWMLHTSSSTALGAI